MEQVKREQCTTALAGVPADSCRGFVCDGVCRHSGRGSRRSTPGSSMDESSSGNGFASATGRMPFTGPTHCLTNEIRTTFGVYDYTNCDYN